MWAGFDSEFVVGSFSALRGFQAPGTPAFLSPQKPAILNSNSTRNARTHNTWASGSGDWVATPRVIELKQLDLIWFDLNLNTCRSNCSSFEHHSASFLLSSSKSSWTLNSSSVVFNFSFSFSSNSSAFCLLILSSSTAFFSSSTAKVESDCLACWVRQTQGVLCLVTVGVWWLAFESWLPNSGKLVLPGGEITLAEYHERKVNNLSEQTTQPSNMSPSYETKYKDPMWATMAKE